MAKKEVVLVNTKDMEWQPVELPNFPSGAWMKLLDSDEETGVVTALLKFPAGFVEPRHSHTYGHSVL